MTDQNTRTEAQREASRQNGSLSAGPVTEEGRRRSSQNSTKHGLFSTRIVLANESQQLFDDLLDSLLEEHAPATPTEHQFVEDMAAARWKMRRLIGMQSGGYDTDMFIHHDSFNQCFQPNDPGMRHHDAATSMNATAKGLQEFYERSYSRLHRIFCKSLSELQRLQSRRGASPSSPGPQSSPQPSQPPPQEAVPKEFLSILDNEPKPPASWNNIHLKTYAEPETFSFLSKVDASQLNPLCFKSAKESGTKDDFSQFFEPAA